jgi:hypothetical protein
MDMVNRMIDSPMLGKFRVATVAQNKQQNMKNKSMATKLPNQPTKDVKQQKAAPSQAAIAQMAYEIWISTGKQAGRDQQNWFEAEWQLRQS